jgi:hypothetical protein
MPLIMAVEASESGFREKARKPPVTSSAPRQVPRKKTANGKRITATQRLRGWCAGRRTSTISKRRFTLRRCQSRKRWKRLGSFPKKQILTREQAKFIIWCLTYDRVEQRAKGSRYHTYGLLTKLAKTFGVTPECIVQINKRRTWRSINWPKPKQLGRPAKHS